MISTPETLCWLGNCICRFGPEAVPLVNRVVNDAVRIIYNVHAEFFASAYTKIVYLWHRHFLISMVYLQISVWWVQLIHAEADMQKAYELARMYVLSFCLVSTK